MTTPTTTRTATPLVDRLPPRVRDEEPRLLVPIALSAALLAWSSFANLVLGETAYLARNLVLTAVLLGAAHRLGLTGEELGLRRARVRRGVMHGVVAMAVVIVVVGSAAALREVIPLAGALLDDDRAELTSAQTAYHVLVRIPLGTAVFEEVAFRGVLLAVLLRRLPPATATVWAAAVFGLWHVAPTIVALRINQVAASTTVGLSAIAGAVLVTAVAGVGFTWLRLRGGHLVAPVLAHWATNGAGLVAAAGTG
ncbi:CPBP family intramembrane glutamic endopeptidase [Egicoccus sp. AB-alg6-2]|uniref:CPBP family intramembrane glutamic endopeptidase n=1 Tax=Egicoccus sp. AB-alg6-2 TaxID=3242692 RepID=UPI00359E217A